MNSEVSISVLKKDKPQMDNLLIGFIVTLLFKNIKITVHDYAKFEKIGYIGFPRKFLS